MHVYGMKPNPLSFGRLFGISFARVAKGWGPNALPNQIEITIYLGWYLIIFSRYELEM